MYFSYPQIYLQEIPDEITLGISISGCPLGCKGCHSTETWDPKFGEEFTFEKLYSLLERHKHISCFLIYDGEHHLEEYKKIFRYIKVKGLKTALYTGLELDNLDDELKNLCDYIKVGPYIEKMGDLSSKTTNQKMYKGTEDITKIFSKNLS